MPRDQLRWRASSLSADREGSRRLIVACHYPLEAPATYRRDLAGKRLIHGESLGSWLSSLGPHLYCCGHVHAAWAFLPDGPRPALPELRELPCSVTGPVIAPPVSSRFTSTGRR